MGRFGYRVSLVITFLGLMACGIGFGLMLANVTSLKGLAVLVVGIAAMGIGEVCWKITKGD